MRRGRAGGDVGRRKKGAMEQTTEQRARELISALSGELAHHEDAESAVEVYRMANWVISTLDEVKEDALNLAEHDMRQRGIEHLRTPAGSAGWTEPRSALLDQDAWMAALATNRELMRIQRTYDLAEAALRQAQEPYLELPEARFFIR
jgi:hypothetical protein